MSLPVMAIFKESLCHIKEHRRSWLKIGFAPLALLLLSELFAILSIFIPGIFGVAVLDSGLILPLLFLFTLNAVFSVVWGASFYVKGYRYGILNEEEDSWLSIPFNKRLLKTIGYSFCMGLLVKGSLLGVGFLLYVTSKNLLLFISLLSLFLFLFVYTLTRLSLVFPLLAIDHEKPLRTSWNLLKGNSLRMLALISLTSLTIIAILLLTVCLVGLIWFLLTFINPFIAAYIWALGWMIFGKAISVLMSLTLVGIGLEGVTGFCVTFMIEAALGMVNPLLLYVFPFLIALFIPPLVFLTWAIFTKALSLVCATLTGGKNKKENVKLRPKR